MRFLAIVDSNLSEFFEVRVASLRQQVEAGVTKRTPDGLTPAEQLVAIGAAVREQMAGLYSCWNRELRPALEKEGIVFVVPEALEPVQQDWLRDFFEREIFPVLTPIALDPAHPFPFVASGSLNLAALLETNDPEEPDRLGVVQVPRVLPRILRVPSRGASHAYVFLADTIRWQLPQLFARAKILDHTAFRPTRNTNLYVDDEEIENLLTAIEHELQRRRRGEAVRLEVRAPIGERLAQELTQVFDLEPSDVYECDGQVNLHRLLQLLELENDDRLQATPFKGVLQPALAEPAKLFSTVRAGDVLLHHPFDSFDSVVSFVEQAAEDPRVLAIKQTLYRTSEDSPIARALLEAAERGKQVTVVVELKARFDEEKNIRWARRMEEAGVQIVFGDVRLKTHCKLILVVRREEDGIRRYVHIGTGNYNPTTARQYTDLGLFTADPEVTAEVAGVFNLLTSLSTHERWNHLMVAPHTLREGLLARIAREADNARAGRPAGIVAKLNAIQDEAVIRALYAASQAGVRIDSDRARHLLPAPGRPGPVGEHSRALDRRPLPRAQPHRALRGRRRAGALVRERRLDAAQPRRPRRGALPRALRRRAQAARGDPRRLRARRREGSRAALGRLAPHGRRGPGRARAGGPDGAALGLSRVRLRRCWALLALIAACGGAPADGGTPGSGSDGPRFSGPGNFDLTLQVGSKTRTFLVHLPPAFAERGPLPVLLAFHGGGGSAQGFQKYAGLDTVADREGFVVVYPDGTGRFGRRLLTWNAGGCCGRAREERADDVGFALRVLADLARDLPLDRTRVYATGHSNGGMMAYRLAAEAAERIAAIAPVAGAMQLATFAPAKPVPVLHVHSVDDPRALYAGGLGPPFPFTSVRVEHQPVERELARWAALAGCAAEPSVVEQRRAPVGRPDAGHTATLLDYGPCTTGADVRLWKLTGRRPRLAGRAPHPSGAPDGPRDARDRCRRGGLALRSRLLASRRPGAVRAPRGSKPAGRRAKPSRSFLHQQPGRVCR